MKEQEENLKVAIEKLKKEVDTEAEVTKIIRRARQAGMRHAMKLQSKNYRKIKHLINKQKEKEHERKLRRFHLPPSPKLTGTKI